MNMTPEEIAALGLDGMQAGEGETIDLDTCIANAYPGTVVPKAGHRLILKRRDDTEWVEMERIDIEEGDMIVLTVHNGVVCAEVICDGSEVEQ